MTDRETQLSRSVREVQNALDFLSRLDPTLPTIIPDGIYGPTTAAAVRVFQETVGLPPTGKVDLATWNGIFTAYRRARQVAAPAKGIFPFGEIVGLIPNSKADTVYLLQTVLRALRTNYDFPAPPLTGTLDEETMESIRAFQRLQALPPTGLADRATWDALATAYNRYLGEEG